MGHWPVYLIDIPALFMICMPQEIESGFWPLLITKCYFGLSLEKCLSLLMVLSLSKFLKHYDFLMEYDRYILLSSVTTFLRTETWIETKLSLVTVSIAHIPHTCSPKHREATWSAIWKYFSGVVLKLAPRRSQLAFQKTRSTAHDWTCWTPKKEASWCFVVVFLCIIMLLRQVCLLSCPFKRSFIFPTMLKLSAISHHGDNHILFVVPHCFIIKSFMLSWNFGNSNHYFSNVSSIFQIIGTCSNYKNKCMACLYYCCICESWKLQMEKQKWSTEARCYEMDKMRHCCISSLVPPLSCM